MNIYRLHFLFQKIIYLFYTKMNFETIANLVFEFCN